MGIDWETLLGVEGAALGSTYEEYVMDCLDKIDDFDKFSSYCCEADDCERSSDEEDTCDADDEN